MKKVLITFVIILGITSIGHALVLPQATRCLFIDLYAFEKEDDIYFRSHVNANERAELKSLIDEAEKRVAAFWDKKLASPKFIYCDTDEDYLRFGAPFLTPAAAVMHIGSYVVISSDGMDLDIISHELSHTELFERIGLINRSLKIPVWFDEGLAMQVDHRSYYSWDTLKALSNNYRHLPNVKSMKDYASFGTGTRDEIMMNYRTAKYEVHKWYTTEKLEALIIGINNGKSFEELY
ncbi:hypothetical protein [Ekhidna sp.]|uniref:hypothetical protein n=1 Tax=Ekhidna sp. TaxID=2608089 RepID=UPI003BA91B4A